MIPYSHFFAFYGATLVAAVLVGLSLLGSPLQKVWRHSLAFLRKNYIYVVILAALPLAVQSLNMIKASFGDAHDAVEAVSNARLVFGFEGDLIPSLQRTLDSDLLGAFLIFTYMWVFSFLTYFLPILLVAKRNRPALVTFTLAMSLNYIVLVAFYTLFPVSVSSDLPGANVQPLLYSTDYWGTMATGVNPLTNCFPSAHISLSFTAFIVFAIAGREYRGLTYALGATAFTLVIAVLYLGIHYPADVLGGLALAASATYCAANGRVRRVLGGASGVLSRLLLGIPGKEEPGYPGSRET